MTPRSAAATSAARRLWAHAAGSPVTPDQFVAAATSTWARLCSGLGRWVGANGYRALVDRALGLARVEHPALGGLSCDGNDAPAIATAVRTHGAAAVAAGMVATLAALIELLGRIIGEETATRLVEQSGSPHPRGAVSTEKEGGRDG